MLLVSPLLFTCLCQVHALLPVTSMDYRIKEGKEGEGARGERGQIGAMCQNGEK